MQAQNLSLLLALAVLLVAVGIAALSLAGRRGWGQEIRFGTRVAFQLQPRRGDPRRRRRRRDASNLGRNSDKR